MRKGRDQLSGDLNASFTSMRQPCRLVNPAKVHLDKVYDQTLETRGDKPQIGLEDVQSCPNKACDGIVVPPGISLEDGMALFVGRVCGKDDSLMGGAGGA